MQIEAGTEIAAPPADVFAFFTQFGRSSERVASVVSSEMLTAEPVRPGTRFREVRRQGEQDTTFEFEVTALDPPQNFEVVNVHAGIRWQTRYDFQPRGSRTVVRLVMTARPVGLRGWLILPMIWTCRTKIQTAMQSDLRDMEKAAERVA